MERSKYANKDDPLVLRGNRHKVSNYWTRVIAHKCLLPKTWLQCQLCNCGHCVAHISYRLLEPKPSFKNASYKSKNIINHHYLHHRLHIHRHVYNWYRHPLMISPDCSDELTTLERIWATRKKRYLEDKVHLLESAWLSCAAVQCLLEVLLRQGNSSVKPMSDIGGNNAACSNVKGYLYSQRCPTRTTHLAALDC